MNLRAGIHKRAFGELGDVKYHQGFSSDLQQKGAQVHLALSSLNLHLT